MLQYYSLGMSKLSNMIMALESPEYKEYIQILARNIPDLQNNFKYQDKEVLLEFTTNGIKKAVVFGKYSDVNAMSAAVMDKRWNVTTRLNFLKTKLIYSDSSSAASEYDALRLELQALDEELGVLESYKRTINNPSQRAIDVAREAKQHIRRELASGDDMNTSAYLARVKRMKELDATITEHADKPIHMVLNKQPRIVDMKNDEQEKKKAPPKKKAEPKRPRKPKQQGGNGGVDAEKVKSLFKLKFKKFSSFAQDI